MGKENQLQVFSNEEFGEVRTIMKDGEPWFVAKDISDKLGYAKLDSMYKLIDKEDAININPQTEEYQGFRQNGGCLESNKNIFTMKLINESGLYQAIFNSQLPSAKKFKKWVTSEVLPSIRKTGGYVAPMVSGMDTYVLDLAKSMQITNSVVQGIMTTVTRMEDFVKDSIRSKDLQIEETAEMIGLRDRNTKMLTATLKDKLEELTGNHVSATSNLYKRIRGEVFKEAKVTKWEEIPIGDYNRVYAFIDSIDSV